jgi:hypothetical protein
MRQKASFPVEIVKQAQQGFCYYIK